MTTLTLGSGTSAPSDTNELSKLIIWTIERCAEYQPKLELLLPYEEADPVTGLPVRVNRATTWIQRKIIWTGEGASILNSYGCRYRAFVAVPLPSDYNQTTGKLWEKITFNMIDANSPSGSTNTFTPGTGGFIPSTITTYPKLLIWLAEALRTVTNGEEIFEDNPYLSVPQGAIDIIPSTPHGDVLFCRYSVPVPSNHNAVADELYAQALVASNVNLPDSFKS
jgi:hypothetical protein